MSDTKPTQSKPDKCIRCGKQDKVIRRGLCQVHYGEFRTAKSHVLVEELEVWDATLVAQGLILPDARKATNPYVEVLARLRTQTNSKPASEIPTPEDMGPRTETTVGGRSAKKKADAAKKKAKPPTKKLDKDDQQRKSG